LAKHFDFCVIGAGLAGMHIAQELVDRNAKVCVIDPNGIAGGASGTPVGLANPATGRFASKSWKAETSLDFLTTSLEKIQLVTKRPFFKKSGILRPALDEKIASKMKKNVGSDNWNGDSVKWLNENEVKSLHAGINCTNGGVWVKKGLSVQIPDYLRAIRKQIENELCAFYFDKEYEISKNEDWFIRFKDHDSLSTSRLIFTSGIWTKNSECWNHLKLHAVKGQIVLMESQNPVEFDHAVSALGYVSRIDDKRFILGSTYEHSFSHEQADQKGRDYMVDRLKRVLPDLASNSKVISSWAGIRASTPDRKPYLGVHPSLEKCFLFTGLGSKGLLYSAYGAHILTDYLFDNSPIPIELNLNRFTT